MTKFRIISKEKFGDMPKGTALIVDTPLSSCDPDKIKAAIKAAYPEPDKTGNDDAVIEACSKEYETYQGLYIGGKEHLTCLFHLVRATKKGDIVKTNETLKTYVYDINPKVIDGE